MVKLASVFMLAALIGASAMADNTLDQSLLMGSWCYKTSTPKGSSQAKVIDTEWVFLGDGKVEMQSAWMKNHRNKLPYTITGNRIKIPKANAKYDVSELTDKEMLLINAIGGSKSRFIRGKCE